MLRNILVTTATALALTATVAAAQQPTHKSSTIPASHPVPVVASQHAQVPATVVTHKAAATATRAERKAERTERKEERAERKEASKDSTQARAVHHAKAASKAKARGTKAHRKGMKHEAAHDSASARKGR